MAESQRVWLIGGTSDSRAVARLLSDRQIPWIATVVSPRAQRLYKNLPGKIYAGPLTSETLPDWLEQHRITHIIDASHPFAVEVSTMAISTCRPYLRYERPAVDLVPITAKHPNIIAVNSWEDLFAQALHPMRARQQPRILLTTGLKSLHRAIPLWHQAQWWARILPSSEAAAIALGFPRDRLLPQLPPKDIATEQGQWRALNIDTVLTKASGEAGKLPQKIAAAIAQQTRLLILRRPLMSYPQQVRSIEELSDHLNARPK
ncbi:MAG: precorrin-6A reductase [Cyanobacteria bacterium P01_D01_bin.73]